MGPGWSFCEGSSRGCDITDFTTYFPFTGGPAAAEADWGLFAQLWATDGVVRGADSELAVTPTGTPDLNVHVASGEAWIQGYFGRRGTTADFAVTPHATLPRKDIVVARLNLASHKMEVLYRTGVADPAPVPPTPTRTAGTTWDLVLAEISLSAAATSIPAGSITDRRPWSSGGRVTRAATVTNANPLVPNTVDQVPQSFVLVCPVGTGGPGTINTIQAPLSGANPILVMEFSSTNTIVTNTGNLRLGRNLITQAGTILVIEWDGTNWREITRAREVVAAGTIYAAPSGGGEPSYRAITSDDFPAGLWTTSNPSAISQGVALTFTVDYARYLRLGKAFIYSVKVTLTSAGTSGQHLQLQTPFNFTAPLGVPLGTFRIDPTVAAAQIGIVSVSIVQNNVTFISTTSGGGAGDVGANPAFAVGAGDTLKFTIMGELA